MERLPERCEYSPRERGTGDSQNQISSLLGLLRRRLSWNVDAEAVAPIAVRGGQHGDPESYCEPADLLVRRVPTVQHELVAVRIGEERHVAHAGVERVAGELDALGL